MPENLFEDLIPKKKNLFAGLIPERAEDLALVDNPSTGFQTLTPDAKKPEQENLFDDLIPKKFTGIESKLESQSALGRIAEAAQVKETFKGVGLEENQIVSLDEFSDVVFGPPEFEILGMKMVNPLNVAGKSLVVGGAALGETAFEGLFAGFEAGLKSAGQAMIELGVEKSTAQQIIRESIPLMLANAGGGISPRVGAPKPRGRPQKATQAETLALEGPAEPLLLEGPGRRIVESTTVAERLTPEQIAAAANAIDQSVVKARSIAARTPRDPEISTTPLGDAFVNKSPKTKKLPPKEKKAAAHKVENDLQNAMLKIGRPENIAERHNLNFVERQMTEALDSLTPVKRVLIEAGRKLEREPDFVPFREMRLLNGRRGVLQAVHERGTIARNRAGDIVFNGKGFRDVIAPLKGKLPRAVAYFTGKRAQELASQGRENLFTKGEIKALLDAGADKPLFESVFREYQAFNGRVLDFAVQSNLLSKEGKALMQEMNKNFVPFNRVLEEGGVAKPRGSVFNRLKGGKANLNDIFENMVANPARIIEQALINDAKLKVFRAIDEAKMDNFAVRLKPRITKETRVVDANVAKGLEEVGVSPRMARRAAPMMTASKRIADNIEGVFINGQRVLYEVRDPYLLRSLRSVSPKALPLAVRVLAGFKNTLTLGVTLSPEFIIRNLIRDTQSAFIQSQGNFVPLATSLRGLAKRILKDEDYYLNLANGGGFATTYKGDVQASTRLKARYRAEGIRPENVLDTLPKVANKIVEISSMLEESSRLGEFRLVREKTGSLRDAAASAREVSTDFAIRGANDFVRGALSTLPFANARFQGLVRTGRQFKDKPLQTAIKGFIGITIPALALYAVNKDNPKYKALSDWTKDNHYVFIAGDEIFLVPKGFEPGAIFGAIPERMFEVIEKENGKRFADAMLRIFTDTFAANPIPQAVRPLDELRRNENFLDIPIVPSDLQKVAPSEQFRPTTSTSMVELARFIKEDTGREISPLQAEALVRGYLGTLGVYLLDASDSLVRKANGGNLPEKRVDEIPLLRNFIRNSPLRRTQFETDFYSLLGDARMLDATLSKILESGREPTIGEAEEKLLGILPTLNDDASQVAQWNEAMRLIQRDPDLSPAQKRKQIDEILQARNELFESIIQGLPKDFLRERGINQ